MYGSGTVLGGTISGIGNALNMNDDIIIHQEELDSSPDPKPRSRWRRPWKWWLKRIAIFLVLIAVGVGAFLYFNLSKVSVNPFGFGKLKGESEGRVNIMMLGVGDPGHAGEGLSDTNIILSVDTRNKQVALIGIPRDLEVDLPNGSEGKINNAHAQGGVDGSKQVYEDTFGVPIHYYVKANFTGLKQVVDAVGGVEVNNAYNLYDPEYPCDKNQYRMCGFNLKAGPQRLDGATALKYVRCRKGTCGDDFGRAERQQQVMQAIREKATSAGVLANPVALGKLVSAAGDNIKTDLSIRNLMRLNELTSGMDTSKLINVVFSLEPDGFLVASNSSSNLLPAGGDFDDIKAFVAAIFKFGPVWTEHPTVVVQNGTITAGVAGVFQDKIEADGYPISGVSVTNALKRDHAVSKIIDYTGGKKPNTVNYLKGILKVEPTPPETAVKTPPADIVVILGTDYASTLSTGSGAATGASGSSSGAATR